MKKKFLGVVLSVAMVASLLAGCGDSKKDGPADNNTQKEDTADADADKTDEGDAAGGLVGVAMPTKDLQRWNQDGSNMEAELKEAGYEVDLQFASNDIGTQVSQIENMISNGCKVLVVASIDGDSLGTVMDQAKEAGIPVIAYDRLIMNSPAVSYYATFDNYKVGQTQGEYIEKALDLANAGDKTYNIEFVTGDPGDNNVNFFFGGAMDVLQKYLDAGTLVCQSGQTKKDEVATVNWATETAQSRFENILSSYYSDKNLDVVLASNDSTALGVANALASSYTGDYPILTGQDCDVANVKNIIDGKQSMSIFKDTRTLASKVVEMVDSIMKGSEPDINDTETYDNGDHVVPSYLCEPVFADSDNYKDILIDSGYYSEDDLK